ncbi:MAG TPA: farnesyl diphosphate synthase [Sphingomicrobium sp.]|jgi:farnesyl diphosphate synthase
MSQAAAAPAEPALAVRIREVSREIDAALNRELCSPADSSRRLTDAIRHAAIGGGKRLRPLLVCAASELYDVPFGQALRAGLAVECVHVHSLIHDDLPCMDDDDMRRGRPTVHVAFDDATAVLAGDALLALAFQLLGDERTHPSGAVRAQLVVELARAAGAEGMAAGQMLDLFPEPDADVATVTRLQRLKTGALIGWAVEAGAILGEAPPEHRTGLRGYAHSLGLAFQIADDLLDHQGDEGVCGKKLRKDERQGKTNFVTLLGAERARRQAEALVEQALAHLHFVDGRPASLLTQIARFAIDRDR